MFKLYRTPHGAIAEHKGQLYPVSGNWEEFVTNDNLAELLTRQLSAASPVDASTLNHLLPPIGEHQELWACGVTYLRSKIGRQEESKVSGGSDFYGKVYDAVRPEVFFKATPHRVTGHDDVVRIRKDSEWDVPEPELTLIVTPSGKIIGYTIGNDMSSRSIEGENPLYLPQAKTYDQCAALGPCILVTNDPLDPSTSIRLEIIRGGSAVFDGNVTIGQMKRKVEELVSFVYRESSFPHGCLVMTGTGIVPGNDFTLAPGDRVSITIAGIGTLHNTVVRG